MLKHFKDLINSNFPDLEINKVEKIGEGDTYVAFLINDHYLFKKAKALEGCLQLKKEVVLMNSLTRSFSISIPQFALVEKNYWFGAYAILPGLSLSEYLERNEFTKTHAEQITSFLATLHATSSKIVQDCTLPVMNYFDEYSQDFEYLKEIPTTFFSKKQQEIILEKYTAFLSCKNNFEYTPVLIHNDFSFNHILCDSHSGNITGVIDFGDAAFGDAAYDFIFLYELPKRSFIENICTKYGVYDEHFIKRIHFYSFANTMQILIGCFKEKNVQLIYQEKKKVQNWFKIHLQSIDF